MGKSVPLIAGLLIAAIFFAYAGSDIYEYVVGDFNLSFPQAINIGVQIAILAWYLSAQKNNAAGIFQISYSAFGMLPIIIFSNLGDKIQAGGWILISWVNFILHFVLLLTVNVSQKIKTGIKIKPFLKFEYVVIFISILSAASFLYLVIFSGLSPSFGLEDHYDRRINARFAGINLFVGYLLSTTGGSIFAISTTHFYKERKNIYGKILLFNSLFILATFFSFFGIKSNVYLFLLLSFFSYFLVNGKEVLKISGIFVLATVIVALILFNLNSGDIALDLLIRRAFVVKSVLNSYFMNEYIYFTTIVEKLFGMNTGEMAITYYIGSVYFYSDQLNANSGFIPVALLGSGLLGYFSALIAIFMMFNILVNSVKTNNLMVASFGFYFGYLLTEQSFGASLLTSGVAIFFIISLITKNSEAN